jgi:hypothetical protein
VRGSRRDQTPYRGLVSLCCAGVGVFRSRCSAAEPRQESRSQWTLSKESRSARYFPHSSSSTGHPSKIHVRRTARRTEKRYPEVQRAAHSAESLASWERSDDSQRDRRRGRLDSPKTSAKMIVPHAQKQNEGQCNASDST